MLRRILPLSASLLLALLIVASLVACSSQPAATTPAKTTPAATTPAATTPAATTPATTAAKTTPPATTPPATTPAATTPAATTPAATTPAATTPTSTVPPRVAADTTVVEIKRLAFPNPDNLATGSTDSMQIDQDSHLLFVSNSVGSYIDVFDVSKPDPTFFKIIRLSGSPYVMSLAKDIKRAYTANGEGTVSVVDIDPASKTANTEIAVITMPNKGALDGVEYIPGFNKLYVTNNVAGRLHVVDTKTNTVIKTVEGLGFELEPAYFNPTDKMVYITGQGTNVIYKFDPNTDTQVAKYDSGEDSAPTHQAVKPGSNIGLIGSMTATDQKTIVWDYAAGKVIRLWTEVGGGDVVMYSPATDLFFEFASRHAPKRTLGVFDGNTNFITNIPGVSHVGTFDETNKVIYSNDNSIHPTLDLVYFTLPKLPPARQPSGTTTGPTATTPAATTPAAGGTTITWDQALLPANAKKTLTVTGPVVAVTAGYGGAIQLNVGKKITDGGLNVEIGDPTVFPETTIKAITDKYLGKNIAVTAKIVVGFQGDNEMPIQDPSQLKIVD